MGKIGPRVIRLLYVRITSVLQGKAEGGGVEPPDGIGVTPGFGDPLQRPRWAPSPAFPWTASRDATRLAVFFLSFRLRNGALAMNARGIAAPSMQGPLVHTGPRPQPLPRSSLLLTRRLAEDVLQGQLQFTKPSRPTPPIRGYVGAPTDPRPLARV